MPGRNLAVPPELPPDFHPLDSIRSARRGLGRKPLRSGNSVVRIPQFLLSARRMSEPNDRDSRAYSSLVGLSPPGIRLATWQVNGRFLAEENTKYIVKSVGYNFLADSTNKRVKKYKKKKAYVVSGRSVLFFPYVIKVSL